MRTLICSIVAMTVLVTGAMPVWAAGKMVPEEGAVEVMLLLQPAVCKELNLTADERDKIAHFASAQWKKAETLSELDEAERDKKFTQMTKENEKFLKDVLSKDQKKRLDEILLQTAGLLWVTRPEIAKELKLSSDQKKRAADLQQTARDEMEELVHATKEEQKEEKLAELRKTSRDRLMTLLTAEQKSKWKEMTGQPFKGQIYFAEQKKTTR